jgi:hypothetical protein
MVTFLITTIKGRSCFRYLGVREARNTDIPKFMEHWYRVCSNETNLHA